MGNTSCCAAHSSPPPQRRLPSQGRRTNTTSIISPATSRVEKNTHSPRIHTTPQEFHSDVEELYKNLKFTSLELSSAKKRIDTLESAYSDIKSGINTVESADKKKNEDIELLKGTRSTLNQLSATVDEVIHILALEDELSGEESFALEFSDAIGQQLSKLNEQLQDPDITEDHRQQIGEWIRDISVIGKRRSYY